MGQPEQSIVIVHCVASWFERGQVQIIEGFERGQVHIIEGLLAHLVGQL